MSLRAFAEVPRSPDGYALVSTGIGLRGELLFLYAPDESRDGVLGHKEQPRWATFPNAQTKGWTPLVARLAGGKLQWCALEACDLAHPHVQATSQGLLLVAARSYLDKGVADKNAVLFDSSGKRIDAFCLGDGIEDVQVDEADKIWVSYFDEGVFGNYGWGRGTEPMGADGLVAYDISGRRLWSQSFGIDDCYALNVENGTTNAYYYSDWKLLRVAGDFQWTRYEPRSPKNSRPISRVTALAVHGEQALMLSVQDAGPQIVLVELTTDRPFGWSVSIDAAVDLAMPGWDFRGRGSRLFGFLADRVYAMDLAERAVE